jgi:hypothetical protein
MKASRWIASVALTTGLALGSLGAMATTPEAPGGGAPSPAPRRRQTLEERVEANRRPTDPPVASSTVNPVGQWHVETYAVVPRIDRFVLHTRGQSGVFVRMRNETHRVYNRDGSVAAELRREWLNKGPPFKIEIQPMEGPAGQERPVREQLLSVYPAPSRNTFPRGMTRPTDREPREGWRRTLNGLIAAHRARNGLPPVPSHTGQSHRP